MRLDRRTLTIAGAVTALAAGGTGAGLAVAGGDAGEGATGPDADRARAAALAVTHGGTVNAVERDGEDGATWEVEVTRRDGTTVDVRLGDRFELVVVEVDHEER
jgi:hypothetical protein